MLYYLIKPFIGIYSKVYFKKIYFTGLDKLPWDKPLILAANHPTAFIDPIIIGGNSFQGRNFLLRGDMFRKGKIVESILRSLKCIPIFRFRDGYAEMKKNQAIMDYCYDLLGEGENLLILAEGVAKTEKRMRTIQKGPARMLFGAYEKHQRKDMALVPIGINYTNPNQFRSIVYANFGTPIPITDFLEDHEKNPRKAIKRMTDRLSKEMRKQIIHIEKEEDDELGTQLLKIAENTTKEKAFPRLSYQVSRLPDMWQLIEKVNTLPKEEKLTLKTKSNRYFNRLEQLHIKDVGIAQVAFANLGVFLALLVGLPAFIVGILGNIVPIKFGKYFAEKKANTVEFNSSLRLAFEAFSCMVYYLILFILVLIFGSWWQVLTVILLPFFGHFSLQWLDFFKVWNEARKAKALSKADFAELVAWRKELENGE